MQSPRRQTNSHKGAEPGQGYDAKAAAWPAKLTAETTTQPTE